jgi:hypothetical protein
MDILGGMDWDSIIMTISSLFWPTLGAILAIGLEITYRRAESFPLWALLPALALTFAVYQTIQHAPSLIVGVAIFTLGTLVLRMAASQWILDEPVVRGNLAAALLMTLAVVVGKVWR